MLHLNNGIPFKYHIVGRLFIEIGKTILFSLERNKQTTNMLVYY